MEHRTNDRSASLKPMSTPGDQHGEPTKPEIIIRVSGLVGKEATILLHPTGPNTLPPDKADIQALIQEHGISHGINWPLIDDLCNNPVYHHVFLIAQHTPPQKGADGYVEYLFNTTESFAPKMRDDGSVDYKNTDYIKSAEKGAALCRRHPARKGTDGTDIFGVPLDGVYGESPMNPAGKNTYLSPDGAHLYASVSGHVRHSFGIVAIEEVLTVDCVDSSTGNILFHGDVVVKGDIAPEFTVRATGNISIKGSVEGAVIEAGQDVSVAGNIIGASKGALGAGSDIRCKSIQNCDITASGTIYADSILLSNVKCGGDLILSGKEAAIVGGCAQVAGKVEANTVGSPRQVMTEITLTSDNARAEEISQNAKLANELGAEMTNILAELARLEAAKKNNQSDNHRNRILDLTSRYNECAKRREAAKVYTAQLQNKWNWEVQSKYFVIVKGTLYANTRITIGDEQLLLKDDWVRCRAHLTSGGVAISHL